MKILILVFLLVFANTAFAASNEDDFEVDVRQGLNALIAAKENNIAKYNKIKENSIPVLRSAITIASLNYINNDKIDLDEVYDILIKYQELKEIIHKIATPILKNMQHTKNTNVAKKILSEYFTDANLSLEQKIELISASINLGINREKCIRIINNIWRENYFENTRLWNGYFNKYKDVLTEESNFAQAKILLLHKQYGLVNTLKRNIKNTTMLATINVAEKIANNNIKDFSFLNKIDEMDDIVVISLMDSFHEKHRANLYYNVGMKAMCNSGGLVKAALWKKYKYIVYEIMKNASSAEYEMAYRLLNHCQNFEGEEYMRQQFLSGWIDLEYLHNAIDAIPHFMNLVADSKDMASATRGYYWLGRSYSSIDNNDKAERYYSLATTHPFYFYGQMAMYETGQNIEKTIFDALQNLQNKALNYNDKTENSVNLLTYIAKIFYHLGRHDIAMCYTRYMLTLPIEPEIRASGLHRITYKTERDFAINMGRYGRLNGVPLIDISYPQHDNTGYPSIIKAVILKESMFDKTTLSTKNAKGLMQVRDSVFKGISKEIKVKKIKNNKDNVLAGSYLLQKLLDRYHNNTLALAAYNAGPTPVSRWIKEYGRPADHHYSNINWIESIPYQETFNYVVRVTEALIVYDALKNTLM